MKVACPSCGYTNSITEFANEVEARQSLALAMRMPSQLHRPMLQYLSLFRPAKQSLRWPRVKNLLTELLGCIESGQIERHGRTWVAPLEHWRAALDVVLGQTDKLTLPLKDHAYLYQVLASMTDKKETIAEARREQQRQHFPADARNGMKTISDLVGNDIPASETKALKERGRSHARALLAQVKPGLTPDQPPVNNDSNGENHGPSESDEH